MYLFVVLIEGSKNLGEKKFKCFNHKTSLFSELNPKTREYMLNTRFMC